MGKTVKAARDLALMHFWKLVVGAVLTTILTFVLADMRSASGRDVKITEAWDWSREIPTLRTRLDNDEQDITSLNKQLGFLRKAAEDGKVVDARIETTLEGMARSMNDANLTLKDLSEKLTAVRIKGGTE